MRYPFLTRLGIHALLIGTTCTAQALTPPATPVVPRYEVVDALGSIDVVTDIAVDPRGSRPAILYYDTTTADAATPRLVPLKLARYDRYSWVSRTLGWLNRRDFSADARSIRLAIDQSGAPHALAIESNSAGTTDDALLYFGQDAQGAAIREQIEVAGINGIALAVDGIANPCVAYTKGSGALTIRRRANGAWQEVALSPAPSDRVSSLSFASYPADANFLAMHLAWVETSSNSSTLRRAVVSTQTATASTIASSTSLVNFGSPQLVVDRFGTLEVAYVSGLNVLAPTIEVRRRMFNQTAWECIDTGCSLPTGPLPSSFALSTHGYVQGTVNFLDASSRRRTLRREGPAWVNYALGDLATAQGSVRDQFGNVYTTGMDRSTHRDLFAVRIGGPWESRRRIPFDVNTVLSGPLAVASDAQSHPAVYARRAFGAPDPRGVLWLVGDGDDFVAHPLPGVFTAQGASIAVAADGRVHVAIYDGDQDNLLHVEFTPGPEGGNWVVTHVDALGDAGAFPTMLIGNDDLPMIVYRRRPDLMHLAARAPNGDWTIRTLASAVFDGAQPVAVASREAAIVHVSWFDGVRQELRITSLRGSPLDSGNVATSQSLPAPDTWVSGRVHNIAMLGGGGVAVAHSNEVAGQAQQGYSYRDYRGQWFNPGEPQPFGAGQVTRIARDNAALSPSSARLAWIAGGRLHYAEQQLGITGWASEDLGTIAPTAFMQFGAAGPLRITYSEGSDLLMLQRLEDLGVDGANTDIYAYSSGIGGIFDYCACRLRFNGNPAFCTDGSKNAGSVAPLKTRQARSPTPSPHDALAGMRSMFSTTAAGRYYLQLFTEHAAEIIGLTLSNPALLEQRARTLSDLAPGLTALVDSPGAGQHYRFKPELIANARAVVQGWGDAGSPALAAAVANELAAPTISNSSRV